MVMIHSDNKGLVLPPRLSPVQCIVVPIPFKDADREAVVKAALDISQQLKDAGIRSKEDARANYSPGWKYNHWELKGVPLRVELGPRDLANKQVVAVRRDTGEKIFLPWENIVESIQKLLDSIQSDLLAKAREQRDSSIAKITKWEDFIPALDSKKMVLAPWCDEIVCSFLALVIGSMHIDFFFFGS